MIHHLHPPRALRPCVASLLAALLCSLSSHRVLASTVPLLENPRLRITVDEATGALGEIVDVRSGQAFSTSGGDLWELQFPKNGGTVNVGAGQAGSFRIEAVSASSRERRLVWQSFPPPAPPGLKVEVLVRLPEQDETSHWKLAVHGLEQRAPGRIRFPILSRVPAQPGENLAVPMWMGQLASDPRRVIAGSNGQARTLQWHYPGELSIQCLAIWGERVGMYLACDDTASFRKAFAVHADGKGGLGCEGVHWPEAAQGARWELPYDVLLGTFQGDWFTAAERYRAWATNQAWATESRLTAGAVPPWVSETALWVWNRGRSEGVLSPALELRRRLGLPVSVFWHWWHGCSYDTGFPEYLPPREGTGPFTAAVARARDRRVNALVYMNQRLWGMTTQSWTNTGAATWAVKAEDGKIRPEVYNTFTRAPCASMCLGTQFWRDTYAGLAEQAVLQLGVSGIYMDQACLSLSCYDPAHGHPVGGGTYWVNGFRRLAGDIRQRCAPDLSLRRTPRRGLPALAGEGCGEPWLSQLDIMLSLQVSKERYAGPDGWETIPFFHAVYHPYAVLFGNYSSLTMPPYDELWPAEFAPKTPLQLLDPAYSTQFRLEQARAFVWGQQPTIANFTIEQFRTRPAELDYVLQLAKLRHRSTRYLLHGTFLKPPEVDAPRATIPMSRLSIYAGQQGGLKHFEKETPLVLGSAWRAPDGRVAFVLASIANQECPVRLRFRLKDYGLTPGSKVRRLGEKRALATLGPRPDETLQLNMPPRSAWVLEFATR